MEDTWPATPLPNNNNPPPSSSPSPGYGDFEAITAAAAAIQPASDAASSTTTITSTIVTSSDSSSALTASSSVDISSTPQTTPEVDDFTGSSKHSVAASEDGQSVETSSTSRRRSMRLKSTVTTTTLTGPATPKTRVDTTVTTKTTTTISSASTTKARSLRSADVKAEAAEEASSAGTRRQSTRISAIAAIAKIISTPAASSSKRSHEIMAAGSKSADAKLGGSYGKKTKLDLVSVAGGRKDAGSSTASSRGSEAPSSTTGSEESDAPPPRRRKVWVNQGLYVGVEPEGDGATLKSASAKKKQPKGKKKRQPLLPLPILKGATCLETVRDFKLPHFVFAPSPYKLGPIHDWRRLNHNVFIGDASQFWKKEKSSQIKCVCEDECNDNCLNRCTWMECDDESCSIGRQCQNRAFADLKERVRTGTKFAEGVEVIKTDDRGYGLRATRSFDPHRIIVEYTGEIITQEESERRMDEVYIDKKNYYLMLFDQNMILDATRGSVARFVNHSCAPNSRMEKWLVEGKPRMALFAGDSGVEAGDELTYDYNFNWFKGVTQQSCKCGAETCRGTLGKRTDAPRVRAKPLLTPKSTKSKSKSKSSAKRAAPHTAPPAVGKGRGKNGESIRYKPKGVQRNIILPAKPPRKPPTQRRLPTPPPPPREPSTSEEPESPPPRIIDATPISSPPKPPTPLVRKMRDRPRVTRTYKVGKTIAPTAAVVGRSAVSMEKLKGAFENAVGGVRARRSLVLPVGA